MKRHQSGHRLLALRAEHAPSAEIDCVQIGYDLRNRSSVGLIDMCARQPALRHNNNPVTTVEVVDDNCRLNGRGNLDMSDARIHTPELREPGFPRGSMVKCGKRIFFPPAASLSQRWTLRPYAKSPALWRRSEGGWGREKGRAGCEPGLLGRFSRGYLTRPGMPNHIGAHADQDRGVPHPITRRC